jgi:O-antigen ligase
LLPQICDRVVLSATLFLIIFAPLAYGAVDPWAQLLIRIVVLVMLGSWALKTAYLRNLRITIPPFWLPALLFLLLLIVQLFPMPLSLRVSLSPEPLRHSILLPTLPDREPVGIFAGWTQLTIYPKATWEGLLDFVTCVVFCWVLLNNLNSRQGRRLVTGTLLAVGSFEAVYGLAEFWSGRQAIFWFAKVHYRQEVSGTYVNHNHFAGLMAMLAPLVAGLAWGQLTSNQRRKEGTQPASASPSCSCEGPQFAQIPKHVADPTSTSDWAGPDGTSLLVARPSWDLALLFASLGVMLVGLILSLSRGGLVGYAIAFACLIGLLRRRQRRRRDAWRPVLWLAVLVGCIGLAFGREIATRFSYTIRDAPERLGLWRDGLNIARDFRWFGTGMGTFQYVLPNYRSQLDFLTVDGVPRQALWNFAHNDYLQLLIECGLLGFALALWAAYVTLRTLWQWQRESASAPDPYLATGALAGVFAILVHSLVDFNLHIPANALIFCVLLSLALVCSQPTEAISRRSDGGSLEPR